MKNRQHSSPLWDVLLHRDTYLEHQCLFPNLNLDSCRQKQTPKSHNKKRGLLDFASALSAIPLFLTLYKTPSSIIRSVPLCAVRRQCVTSLVLRMSIMSFHPDKSNLMLFLGCQKPFPQIHVFDRLIFPALPAFLDPSIDPVLIKRIHHIFGIRIQLNAARTVQRFQSFDHRHQLHPVVRCPSVTTGQFSCM